MNTIDYIKENKLIVIMRGLEEQEAVNCAKAMQKGGIRLIEVTFDRTKDDYVTGNIIKVMNDELGDKICIGAGSVVTETQLMAAYDAGAKYIISPNTNTEIIKKTKSLGMVSIPGALTPSEILTAYDSGADYVKIFPISAFNESYVKDLMGPMSYINYLAVGGVNLDNMETFMKYGVCGFGVGGAIINKTLIKNGEFDKITALAKEYTDRVKEISR